MGRLIILTGAPESDRLDWSTPDLLHTFHPSIATFALLQPQGQDVPPSTAEETSLPDLAVWRSLPLQRTHVPTGFSQQHDMQIVNHFPSSADFLTTAGISFDAASQALTQDEADGHESRLLVEWYEHSLALHDDLASSQLVRHSSQTQSQKRGTQGSPTCGANSTSISSTSDEPDTTITITSTVLDDDGDATILVKDPLQPGQRAAADHLSDLDDIPPARYLQSIQPQTMTVTLIVGIISIAAPRAISTRFGTAKTLVEVLVGDDTKSGFSVTFWLTQTESDSGSGSGAAGPLAGLRAQDVVLMRNVALNVFRGRVYGGSLPRGMTTVYLLHRGRRLGAGDPGGHYSGADLARAARAGKQLHPQLGKTSRVRDWVLKFVGGPAADSDSGSPRSAQAGKGRKRPAPRDWNQPPPLDSQ